MAPSHTFLSNPLLTTLCLLNFPNAKSYLKKIDWRFKAGSKLPGIIVIVAIDHSAFCAVGLPSAWLIRDMRKCSAEAQ
ncbi:hypothetical protein V8C37DRAFT_367900 [Trichoderma ceciliae]